MVCRGEGIEVGGLEKKKAGPWLVHLTTCPGKIGREMGRIDPRVYLHTLEVFFDLTSADHKLVSVVLEQASELVSKWREPRCCLI